MMTEDLEELRAKAEQGDAASQYQLGIRYFLGDGPCTPWGSCTVRASA